MDELILTSLVWSFLWASWLAALNHNEEENGPAWQAILFLTLINLEGRALVISIGLWANGAINVDDLFQIAAIPGFVLSCRAARYLLKYPRTFL